MDPARTIVHVDMDAFYAAIEARDRPELRGLPVIIGSANRRGVVATASYEARAFGVHSAMPGTIAARLCPQAIFIAPRMAHYAEVSQQIFSVFEQFTPQIESLSLDEAFLDVSASLRLFGSARAIGAAIKAQVRAQTGLDCSVGMAPNKLLAKLASELDKPDGLTELDRSSARLRLDPLPVGKLWTIGKVATERLAGVGIQTIGQLRLAPEALVRRALGGQAAQAQALARGDDERPVVADRQEQSIGAEHTFDQDLVDFPNAQAWLLRLVERVAERARAAGLQGCTVRLKLRAPPFITAQRQTTLAKPSAATDLLFNAALPLLAHWWQATPKPRLRLLGFTLAGFSAAESSGAAQQTELFGAPAASGAEPAQSAHPARDQLIDAINRRFGTRTVSRAATLRTHAGTTEPEPKPNKPKPNKPKPNKPKPPPRRTTASKPGPQ